MLFCSCCLVNNVNHVQQVQLVRDLATLYLAATSGFSDLKHQHRPPCALYIATIGFSGLRIQACV